MTNKIPRKTDATSEPPEYRNWPRDLTQVEALTGKKPSVPQVPQAQMKAVSYQSGDKPQLVLRTITFDNPDGTVHEDPITLESSLQTIFQNEKENLPASSLINVNEPSEPTEMRTWNAHVRVNKFVFTDLYTKSAMDC